MELKESSV
uniref:Uncharacterized protein n=1 Tax=Anguilla anguilla TaxID=7936 RepID=A0A0E9RS91_ANGAN